MPLRSLSISRVYVAVCAAVCVAAQPSPSGTPAMSISGTPAMSISGTPAASRSVDGSPSTAVTVSPFVLEPSPSRSPVSARIDSSPSVSPLPRESQSRSPLASTSPITADTRVVSFNMTIAGATVQEVLAGPVVTAIINSTAATLGVPQDRISVEAVEVRNTPNRLLRVLRVLQGAVSTTVVLRVNVIALASEVQAIVSAAPNIESTAVKESVRTALVASTGRSAASFTVTPAASTLQVVNPSPQTSGGSTRNWTDLIVGLVIGGVILAIVAGLAVYKLRAVKPTQTSQGIQLAVVTIPEPHAVGARASTAAPSVRAVKTEAGRIEFENTRFAHGKQW